LASRKPSFFSALWEDTDDYFEKLILQITTDPEADAAKKGSAEQAHGFSAINDIPKEKMPGTVYRNEWTTRSDAPIIVDLRPDGNTQLRIYYTNETSSSILPDSWVDIKTH
jgi:hypothetical protein